MELPGSYWVRDIICPGCGEILSAICTLAVKKPARTVILIPLHSTGRLIDCAGSGEFLYMEHGLPPGRPDE